MKTHQSLNYFFILSILFACSSKERKPRVIEVPGGEKYADLPLYVTAAGNTIAYADAEKVYFFDFNYGFLYTYNGGYTPEGYFFPVSTHLLNRDLYIFMQNLLDTDYYIVIDDTTFGKIESLLPLTYSTARKSNNLTVIKKDLAPISEP